LTDITNLVIYPAKPLVLWHGYFFFKEGSSKRGAYAGSVFSEATNIFPVDRGERLVFEHGYFDC